MTTNASRALLDEWWPLADEGDPESVERQDAARAIAKIEAEKEAEVRARLGSEVSAVLYDHDAPVHIALAVLAVIQPKETA